MGFRQRELTSSQGVRKYMMDDLEKSSTSYEMGLERCLKCSQAEAGCPDEENSINKCTVAERLREPCRDQQMI